MPVHIAVICKEPIAGRVKTRLVPPLTFEQAAQIAAACLADTFDAVDAAVRGRSDVRKVVLIDGQPGRWIPSDYEVVGQRGDGLADRLANGFDDLGAGLIVGMDTPSAGRWFSNALEAVEHGRDAIGLTHDGGYWGIALGVPDRAVFADVPMSAEHTGSRQIERLAALGRAVCLLPTVHDVDRFEDIAAVVSEAPGSHLAAVAAGLLGPNWG